MLADKTAVFWVDWREEDEAIAGYCETILRTGALSAELVDTDDELGFALHLSYRNRRVKAPLVAGTEDRHITIHALNEILAPDYEIRVCTDSRGMDTLAFVPLAAQDWRSLEARFPEVVRRRFRKIEQRPNLFTEPW